jgi:hypothetical protein
VEEMRQVDLLSKHSFYLFFNIVDKLHVAYYGHISIKKKKSF